MNMTNVYNHLINRHPIMISNISITSVPHPPFQAVPAPHPEANTVSGFQYHRLVFLVSELLISVLFNCQIVGNFLDISVIDF